MLLLYTFVTLQVWHFGNIMVWSRGAREPFPRRITDGYLQRSGEYAFKVSSSVDSGIWYTFTWKLCWLLLHRRIRNFRAINVTKLPVSISTFAQLLRTTFALRLYWSLRPSWEGIPVRYILLIWILPPLLLLRDSKVVRPLTNHFIDFPQFLEYARMHHSADCDS